MLIGDEMTEAELLAGITEALELGGWTWTHIRRSDGVTMGRPGLPDIIATHDDRALLLAWELKTARGPVSIDQLRWLYALGTDERVDARIVRPADYDAALAVIIQGTPPVEAFGR
jgi:hypothetical protein